MEASEIVDPAFWSAPASRVLAPPRLAEAGSRLEARLANEGAVVFASSGSSGAPKWARFRREALLASAEMVNRHLAAGADDVWMLALPLYHVGGFGVAARAHVAGCKLRRFAGKWNAMRFADELEEGYVTLTSLVPTQVHDLVTCELRAPASLRAVVVGGAPLDEVEGQAARDLGWPVLQSYGMTEAGSQIATMSLASLQEEFIAAPLPVLPGWEVRVGEENRLHVRGRALFDGYLAKANGHVATECPLDEEGWFATTDLVEIEGAALTILGRADRRVKILGELVDVQAIEDDLRAHLEHDAALYVLAVPDERRGWRLVPVIEEAHSAAEDVVALVNERLPGFAHLERPRFVRELPRTPLGKIDAGQLRDEMGTWGDSDC